MSSEGCKPYYLGKKTVRIIKILACSYHGIIFAKGYCHETIVASPQML